MFPYLNGVVERAQTYFAHKYHLILTSLGLTALLTHHGPHLSICKMGTTMLTSKGSYVH